MFRVGIVKSQDVINARVRVTFPDRNQMTSWWLPVVTPKAQNDKAYWMPDVGEQVVCLMDEHDEDGAVLGSIYSSADLPPVSSADKWHLTMKDGAAFEYDRSSHALAVSIPNGGTVNIQANGATIQIAADGTINIANGGTINVVGTTVNLGSAVMLAGGGPAVARVGDTTTCPAGAGHITSGSSKVHSG
jgi:phage baseplate assembly protein V